MDVRSTSIAIYRPRLIQSAISTLGYQLTSLGSKVYSSQKTLADQTVTISRIGVRLATLKRVGDAGSDKLIAQNPFRIMRLTVVKAERNLLLSRNRSIAIPDKITQM